MGKKAHHRSPGAERWSQSSGGKAVIVQEKEITAPAGKVGGSDGKERRKRGIVRMIIRTEEFGLPSP